MKYSICIGIDTHARKNAVCALDTDTGEAVTATLPGDPEVVADWIEAQGFGGSVHAVYEAGPTGFRLARTLRGRGIGCTVIAPSKTAYPHDRDKRDPKDAEWLARLLASGAVRGVYVPTEEQEALCRLSKLRDETVRDLKRAKQRLKSFVLVRGVRYTRTKKFWTKSFMSWAESLVLDDEVDTVVFRHKFAAVRRQLEDLERIDREIDEVVASRPELAAMVARLTCVHGIGRVTAFSLVAEVYDFGRFRRGSALASYLGLVPSESSSGERVARGGITKLGNSHLRRLLVEAAGCYGAGANVARAQRTDVSPAVAAKAAACRDRLLKRRQALRERGVPANKAKVAIARELAEWIYHIMVMPG